MDSYAQIFFWKKTCWLPTEPAVTRHNSGHLDDVLITAAAIYRMLSVDPELYWRVNMHSGSHFSYQHWRTERLLPLLYGWGS